MSMELIFIVVYIIGMVNQGEYPMEDKKFVQYAKKCVKKIPKSTWKKLESRTNSGLAILRGVSDKEVASYILKNNLTNPSNLAKFMVNVQVTQITEMYEGFYNVKQDYKNEWKSKLESAKDLFFYALDNPSKKNVELGFARRQVMDCIRVFKNDVMESIQQIRQIDNQSDTKFLLTSWTSIRKCKKESEWAIETTKRLLDAYNFLFTISAHTQDDISSFERNFEDMKKEIMGEDNYLLMAAYCKKDEDKEFWYNLSDTWNEQKQFHSETTEAFGNETENESSFWDDDSDDINFL